MSWLDKTISDALDHMGDMNAALQRIILEGPEEEDESAVLILCKGAEAEEVNDAIDALEEEWHR
jgi:hypothetical protein